MAERVKLFKFSVDRETAFAGDKAVPSYSDIQVVQVPSKEFKQLEIPDERVRADVGEHPPIVGPKYQSTFSFKTYPTGRDGTEVPDGAHPATTLPMGKIFSALIGTEVQNGTSTVAVGGGAVGAVTVAAGEGARFSSNTIVGFVTANFGTVYRLVTVAGDVLTPSYELPEAPADAAAVIGGDCYQFTTDIAPDGAYGADITSWQSRFLGERADSKYRILGCMGDTMDFECGKPGEVPTYTFGVRLADWEDDETGALAGTTITGTAAWMNARHELVPTGSLPTYSAAFRRKARNIKISLARGLKDSPDPHGAQGIDGWESGGEPMWNVNMELDIDDAWRDAFPLGSTFELHSAFGNTRGSMDVWYMRSLHLKAYPTDGEADGRMITPVQFGVTSGVTAPTVVLGLL